MGLAEILNFSVVAPAGKKEFCGFFISQGVYHRIEVSKPELMDIHLDTYSHFAVSEDLGSEWDPLESLFDESGLVLSQYIE